MTTGRIIDGARFDAQVESQALLASARREADAVVAQAQRKAEQILVDAALHAAVLRRDTAVSAPPIGLLASRANGLHGADADTADSVDTTDAARPADGVVSSVIGVMMRATCPGVSLGEQVWVERGGAAPMAAQVVGFVDDQAVMLPLGETTGLNSQSRIWRSFAVPTITVGPALLGRVLDGVGRPIDDGPALLGEAWPVIRPAPAPLSRTPIAEPFATGIRAIDGVVTLGRGQRMGLFAAAGVGKSTLLARIAQHADADVIVSCLVGERGREVRDFVDGVTPATRRRSVFICATSDASPLERVRAVQTATAIAEWFRDCQGASVLLLVDSLTRVARAQREVGLSAGEPVARHGYPPSVFALLPRLVERAGTAARGAITAVYTVLVAGDDLDEPIADEVRGLLDGHLILDRSLAQRGHFPAIDIVRSNSRVMHLVASPAHNAAASALRARCAVYEEHRDLITLGAYKAGHNRALDAAVAAQANDLGFLQQHDDVNIAYAQTVDALRALARAE